MVDWHSALTRCDSPVSLCLRCAALRPSPWATALLQMQMSTRPASAARRGTALDMGAGVPPLRGLAAINLSSDQSPYAQWCISDVQSDRSVARGGRRAKANKRSERIAVAAAVYRQSSNSGGSVTSRPASAGTSRPRSAFAFDVPMTARAALTAGWPAAPAPPTVIHRPASARPQVQAQQSQRPASARPSSAVPAAAAVAPPSAVLYTLHRPRRRHHSTTDYAVS